MRFIELSHPGWDQHQSVSRRLLHVPGARRAHQFTADLVQDAVDKLAGLGGGEPFDEVDRFVVAALALAHAVADDLAAAELDLVAVAAALRDQVALDLDEEIRVGEPDAIANMANLSETQVAAFTTSQIAAISGANIASLADTINSLLTRHPTTGETAFLRADARGRP